MLKRKRYAHVGVGERAYMYINAIIKTFRDTSELAGICDNNRGRLQLYKKQLEEDGYGTVPIYHADEFDKMIYETKPDVVIVTTLDRMHDYYIVKSMKLGCDVITEKPLTIDAKRCQKIVDTVNKTGRKVRVTFNYRYSPVRSQIKELLMQGIIGKILSVDFNWLLDTRHGADYYRRWHRGKGNSGGLLVHKATHHFDLMNWWINSTPKEVFAMGKREFYIPKISKLYGAKKPGVRCHTCKYSKTCKFHISIGKGGKWKELYFDQEKYDGYFRDRCVFGKDINIEDSMNLVVRYKNNIMMSYSLNSFCPWEGYTVNFNGTKGRLEHKAVETVYISGDGTVPGEMIKKGTSITVFPQFKKPYPIKIREGAGGHGGGDILLLDDIFGKGSKKDTLRRSASFAEGAYSILIGVAANTSIKTGKVVQIDKLVKNISKPDFTAMKE